MTPPPHLTLSDAGSFSDTPWHSPGASAPLPMIFVPHQSATEIYIDRVVPSCIFQGGVDPRT